MIKELKSNYAHINEVTGVITLFEYPPASNGFELVIEDCNIEFDESNQCNIRGKRWIWGYNSYNTFLSDLNYDVIEYHKKLGYRTILDWIKGVKSPCVNGWHRKSYTLPYLAVMSKFFVVM